VIIPKPNLLLWTMWLGVPSSVLAGAVAETRAFALATIVVLVAAAIADAVVSRRQLDSIQLSSSQPLGLSVGAAGELQLELLVDLPRPMDLELTLMLPDELELDSEQRPTAARSNSITLSLPGGSYHTRFGWPLRGVRRGRFTIDRCLWGSGSKFRLWEIRRPLPLHAEVRVYPDLRHEMLTLASQFLRRGGAGAHAHRQIGKGREFEKLREYLPGDCLDDVHWKASAKRGQPVTKEYQIERTQEVYALLDVSRLALREHGGEQALERTLRAALTLALATRRYNDLFGLLVFADRIRTFLPARAGKRQYDACREAIFTEHAAPVSPDFGELATFIRVRMRRRALLVFLTDLDDPALAEDFVQAAQLIGRHHLVLVIMILPPTAHPLFSSPAEHREEIIEHLAGHLRWHRLRELSRVLERRGISLVLLRHEELASEVVSQYVAVKQRQML